MTRAERLETVATITGAVIGAGFATGSEINLYFHGKSLLSPIISALLFGGLTALFLLVGKVKPSPTFTRIFTALTTVGALISYGAMSACFATLMGARIWGLILPITCVLLSAKKSWLNRTNLIMVGVIILMIGRLAIGTDVPDACDLGFGSAALYATLNFMTAGELVRRKGKGASNVDVIWIAVATAVIIGALALSMLCIVNGVSGAIPFLTVAMERGLGHVASVVVFCAVFTTALASSDVLVHGELLRRVPRWLTVAFLGAVAVFSTVIGFDTVVGTGYPIASALGMVYVGLTAFEGIKNGARKCMRHRLSG